jgi:hypothetical protein
MMKFNFTENRTVEDIAVVPENCRAFYEENKDDEGNTTGFALKTTPEVNAAVAVISGQGKALKASRQEVADAKAAKGVDLSPLEAYGKTIDEIAVNIGTKVEELTIAASGNESDIAARIAAVKREHGEQVAALTATKDKEITERQQRLENYMVDSAIMNAGTQWRGLDTKLIKPFAQDRMRVADVDGVPSVVIVDKNGEARYSTAPERAGELMNTDELFEEMAMDKSLRRIFPSDQAVQGGGAAGSNGMTVRRGDNTKNMTAAQKIGEGLKKQR